MERQEAEQIIRKNNNYTQAYHEMLDNGADEIEAQGYWEELEHVCGQDWTDPMNWLQS